jgi:hypothetical protein
MSLACNIFRLLLQHKRNEQAMKIIKAKAHEIVAFFIEKKCAKPE